MLSGDQCMQFKLDNCLNNLLSELIAIIFIRKRLSQYTTVYPNNLLSNIQTIYWAISKQFTEQYPNNLQRQFTDLFQPLLKTIHYGISKQFTEQYSNNLRRQFTDLFQPLLKTIHYTIYWAVSKQFTETVYWPVSATVEAVIVSRYFTKKLLRFFFSIFTAIFSFFSQNSFNTICFMFNNTFNTTETIILQHLHDYRIVYWARGRRLQRSLLS